MKKIFTFLAVALSFSSTAQNREAEFESLNSASAWSVALDDDCTDDWRKNWFLDGKIATVENSEEGMHFTAGPKAGDDAHHAVLWTKETYEGDIKIEFDYTRTDSANKYVTILYIQATGDGEGEFTEDITEWSALRETPSMRHYFNNMNLLHISYAAFGNDGKGLYYVRARRYPKPQDGAFDSIRLTPSYDYHGFFKTNQRYHIIAIKSNNTLYFEMRSEDGVELFTWDLSKIEPVVGGRVGLRHMYTRSAIYKNLKVYTCSEEQ